MSREETYRQPNYRDTSRSVARVLRGQATFPERLLWSRLRRQQIGVRFLRQQPVTAYVLDFYCPRYQLAVEIDGRSHDDSGPADLQRQVFLERQGIRFLRFTNDEVLHDIDRVIATIQTWLEEQESHSPEREAPKPPPP